MINWLFNKIFNAKNLIKTKVRIYSDYEKMLLNRLERNRKYCEDEGRYFFIINSESKIDKVRILGYYSFYDVDGTVSAKVAVKDDGEIVSVGWDILYTKKPHDWVIYLSNRDKTEYSNFIKYTHEDSKIIEKFYSKLPVDVKREIILNKVLL
jgi:hypothetical protein